MSSDATRIGVVGCGGFALFATNYFEELPGVRVTAIAEPDPAAAQRAAQQLEVPNVEKVEALVARDDVDLVYIATPPSLHHPQAMAALRAGKHVITEKPLAVGLAQADEMLAVARANDLLLVANLMQRYNPLFASTRRLIESGLLGDVLHGYLENYACDENLGPGHWFWNPALSGGIFVEHSVHFFDMFTGWLGPGRVVAAQRTLRPDSGIEEQVQCTVRYDSGPVVNMYHGFTQPGRLDRQEFRLLFERGDLTLEEWVPTRGRIRGVACVADIHRMAELFEDAEVTACEDYTGDARHCGARHKTFDVDRRFEIVFGRAVDKTERYGLLLRSMMADQTAWIHDRAHCRTITEQNGRDSLEMAVEAKALSEEEK